MFCNIKDKRHKSSYRRNCHFQLWNLNFQYISPKPHYLASSSKWSASICMRNLWKIQAICYIKRLLKRQGLAHKFDKFILRKQMQKRHFQHGNQCWIHSTRVDIPSCLCTLDINNYLPLLQVSKRNTEHTKRSVRNFQH